MTDSFPTYINVKAGRRMTEVYKWLRLERMVKDFVRARGWEIYFKLKVSL